MKMFITIFLFKKMACRKLETGTDDCERRWYDRDIIPSPSARNIFYPAMPDRTSRNLLVHSLVVSRLDYGNAPLFGIPDVFIGKLHKSAELCSPIGCSL